MRETRKKILVTGGAGFIGSHTVVALHEAGYDPVVLDDLSNSQASALEGIAGILGRQVPFYEGRCQDEGVLRRVFKETGPIEGVIHFAASKAVGESVQKPLDYYQNNLEALIAVLRAMSAYGVEDLVFSSSATVYGQPDPLPATEQSPVQEASSPYGNTKKIGEDIIRDTVGSGAALKAMALRYFNPIGAHPSGLIGELPLGVPNNLVPFITQTAAGVREVLTIFGDDYATIDGTCIRDYIHVMDLAEAHVKAMSYLERVSGKEGVFEVVNIGTGRGQTVLELVKTFERVNQLKLNYVIGSRRPGDVASIYAAVDKAEQLLGWRARKSLEEALKDAWRWQRQLMKERG